MRRVLLGDFDGLDECVDAIRRFRALGWDDLDAYLPFPSKEVERALGLPKTPLPWFVLGAGLVGAMVGYGILWWTQHVDYPLDVGGHPTHSVPAFVGITFETAVLFASCTAFLATLALCKLPRLFHPAFEVPEFDRVTVDKFVIAVGVDSDEQEELARRELTKLGAGEVQCMEPGDYGT